MSEPCLPDQIAPFKFARQGRQLQGHILLKGMNRLAELLVNGQDKINVDLQFDFDEQQLSIMRGQLHVDVSMVCQRCMKPMSIPIEANVAVGFVSSDDQAIELPDEYEPCIVQTETLSLTEIVEDELILALPLVALHEDQACEPLMEKGDEIHSSAVDESQDKKNPFAVLSDLKRRH